MLQVSVITLAIYWLVLLVCSLRFHSVGDELLRQIKKDCRGYLKLKESSGGFHGLSRKMVWSFKSPAARYQELKGE